MIIPCQQDVLPFSQTRESFVNKAVFKSNICQGFMSFVRIICSEDGVPFLFSLEAVFLLFFIGLS